MGRNRGRPKRGQLADLTIYPQREPEYEPPPLDQCKRYDDHVVLRLHHELKWNFFIYKRAMVKFAVMQVCWREGQWREVARIDTCHALIHKHQLHSHSPGDTQGTITPLAEIPSKGGWEVIDKWWTPSLTLMQDNWEEQLRLWGGDYD